MCFKNWNRRNLFNKPKICSWRWGAVKAYKKPNHRHYHEIWWPSFCSHHHPLEHPDLSCLPCKEHSVPRCHSTWLICTLQVCSKSFRSLFLICPTWRHSDCVKGIIRAAVGWLWWLNNAWNQQWPRRSLTKWVVGWGQGLVSICGDPTFLSVGSFRLMAQSIWMRFL